MARVVFPVMIPEPPLLLLILPITALYCYWRPERRPLLKAQPEVEAPEPARPEYPLPPRMLKRGD